MWFLACRRVATSLLTFGSGQPPKGGGLRPARPIRSNANKADFLPHSYGGGGGPPGTGASVPGVAGAGFLVHVSGPLPDVPREVGPQAFGSAATSQ